MITTGNIPTTLMMPSEYALEVKAFVAIASSTSLGQGAKEGSPKGSFSFTDASLPASHKPNFETKENSFNVRATGGVKLITGYTASHRELGVVLESKSSAWSILSDEKSKMIESRLDDLDTLEKLSKVPISTWRYQGQHVSHMGPMAQDMYAAFGLGEADRISSSDADGAILSALRGMTELKEQLSRDVDCLHHEMLKNDESIKHQAQSIRAKEERLVSMLENLETLERLTRNVPRLALVS